MTSPIAQAARLKCVHIPEFVGLFTMALLSSADGNCKEGANSAPAFILLSRWICV
jgi:hypothetical protein